MTLYTSGGNIRMVCRVTPSPRLNVSATGAVVLSLLRIVSCNSLKHSGVG